MTDSKPTVWIVFNDKRKDFSRAEEFGQLKDVFSSIGRNYIPEALIDYARHVLRQAQEGDFLLMVGDPTLCGICTTVMAEKLKVINLLRWNREEYKYEPLALDFDWQD